jgi:hypothetical protein
LSAAVLMNPVESHSRGVFFFQVSSISWRSNSLSNRSNMPASTPYLRRVLKTNSRSACYAAHLQILRHARGVAMKAPALTSQASTFPEQILCLSLTISRPIAHSHRENKRYRMVDRMVYTLYMMVYRMVGIGTVKGSTLLESRVANGLRGRFNPTCRHVNLVRPVGTCSMGCLGPG